MKLGYETFRRFSCPTEPSANELYTTLAMAYAGAIRKRIEKRVNALIGENHPYKILQRAKHHIRDIGSSDLGFAPEYGRAIQILETENLGASVAQFALALHEAGFCDEWSLKDLNPGLVSFAGHSILVKSFLSVKSSKDQVNIETASSAGPIHFEFARIEGVWTMAGSELQPNVKIRNRSIPVFIGPNAHPTNLWFAATDVPCVSDPLVVTCTIQEAIDLLVEHVPIYGPWVERSLKRLAIVEGIEENFEVSRSDTSLPGLVHISHPTDLAGIAEALVHECSHQHYHLLQFIDPLVNGKDEKLYPSPVKLAERSLERLLIAFHAVANMWVFFQRLVPSISDRRVRQNSMGRIQKIEAMIPTLLKPLRETDGLTDAGRAIFEPLAEQLAREKAPNF